jgi:hypothetical protein
VHLLDNHHFGVPSKTLNDILMPTIEGREWIEIFQLLCKLARVILRRDKTFITEYPDGYNAYDESFKVQCCSARDLL